MPMRRHNCYCALIFGCVFYLYLINTFKVPKRTVDYNEPQAPQDRLVWHSGGKPPNNNAFQYLEDELCSGEPFVYKQKVVQGDKITIAAGKKFDCKLGLPYLNMFNLNHPIAKETPVDSAKVVFVIAADSHYYVPSRAVIEGIHRHFGNKSRIIYYDLGNTLATPHLASEMAGICNFETRVFKWDLLPKDVTAVKIFAWKILIIAELFNEFETFFYLDSSIFFESGDFSAFFEMINNGSLTPFQMSGDTGHSIKHATHPGMYAYIPIDDSIHRKHDMLEANMMIIHRSEVTRQIVKWALLCGVTRDCIEPPGALLGCMPEGENTPEGVCHRQDQSVYNVLLANLEQQWLNEGRSWLITHEMPNHPKNSRQRHQTIRMQGTKAKIDHCPKT